MEIQGTTSRRLNTALMILVCVAGCGGGNGNGLKLTPEQEVGAGAVCNKAASCSGQSVSSSDMQTCKEQIAGALQLFPDPDAFSTCIQGMSCTDLENGDATKIQACVDFNTSTIKCESDGTSLHACSNSGKCTSISCADVCPLLKGTFDHCGYNSSKGWDVCWCRQ